MEWNTYYKVDTIKQQRFTTWKS